MEGEYVSTQSPTATSLMNRQTCEAPAFEAASMMLDNKISSVLVVNDDDKLVGVVTQTDYLEVARRALLGLPLER